MKLAKLVIAMVLCNLFALGQVVNNKGTKEQDTFTVTVSGTPVIMYDSIGTQTNSFEIVPTGGPATVSVVVVGCMRSGTCSATLTSTTSTSSSVLFTTSGPYDYYQITPSWTGGSSPTIKINRTGTAARSNNGGVAASVPFSGITGGINTSAQMQVSGAAALSPLNIGQVVSDQVWLQPTLSKSVQANFSAINSGGSIASGQVNIFQYTLNSALGETTPNQSLQINMATAGCTIGSCTLTMAAPTIPSGYTGWTTYWCDTAAGCTVPVKVLACVNILTSCSVTNQLLNSGILPPTANTAVIAPPNVQATECPPGVVASLFSPDASGNYHTWGGMLFDSNQTVPRTTGTPVICHSTFFTDQMANPVGGNNAFVVIDHQAGVNTDFANNQDRALWVNMTNLATDVSARYSLTGIQVETDVRGAPTWVASVDGETVAGSFQLEDDTTNSPGLPPGGAQVIRASYFSRPQGLNGLTNVAGVRSSMSAFRASGAYAAGTQFIAFDANWGGSTTLANLQGIGLKLNFPVTAQKYGAFNAGIFIPGVAMTVTSTDWAIRNDFATLNTLLNGPVALSSISNSAPSAAMVVNAALNVQSSATVTQGTIPQPASAPCSGGASSYSYAFVGVDNNGGTVISANANTTAACVNPLTGVNPVTINVTNSATTVLQYAGFVRIDVYRTAGPMGLGKIGSLTCTAAAGALGPSCSAFSDTGIVATGSVPTVNTTGTLNIGGDFTLATSKGQHVNTQAANNDHTGTCTAAAATTCTVTFTRAFTAAPVCVATDATNITTLKVTPSTSSLIITTTGATSDVFDYVCTGNPN